MFANFQSGLTIWSNTTAKSKRVRWAREKVVVFVGKKAARALSLLDGTLLKIDQSPHPSPQVKGRYRGQWDSIPIIWRRVREFIGCDENSN